MQTVLIMGLLKVGSLLIVFYSRSTHLDQPNPSRLTFFLPRKVLNQNWTALYSRQTVVSVTRKFLFFQHWLRADSCSRCPFRCCSTCCHSGIDYYPTLTDYSSIIPTIGFAMCSTFLFFVSVLPWESTYPPAAPGDWRGLFGPFRGAILSLRGPLSCLKLLRGQDHASPCHWKRLKTLLE